MSLELEHHYLNKSDSTLESKFTFPVDPEMAVSSLTVITEDRELEAKILEKD